MTDPATHVLAAGFVWFITALLSAWITAALYRPFAAWQLEVAPENRSLQLLLLAATPPLLATLVSILALRPDWAFTLIPEHCHGALCAPHNPMFAPTSAGGLLLSALICVLGLSVAALLLTALLRDRRQQRLLRWFSRSSRDAGYRVIDSSDLQAWCTGLWRPRAYVSQGLVDALSAEELRAVLAHEQGHALRRDNLRRLLVSALSLPWLPAARARLLSDFYLSTEQACDRSALAEVSDSSKLLSALARVQGEQDGRELDARAQALRQDFSHRSALPSWLALLLLWLAQAAVMVALSHGLLEWLLQA